HGTRERRRLSRSPRTGSALTVSKGSVPFGRLTIFMTRQPERDARDILSREIGFIRKPHGGRLRIALAFPNTYYVGMSNLGFQTVYKLFNAENDIVCERVFLPPKSELAAQLAGGAPLVTLESQTPVNEFDIFAFSVSFEWDYTNVISMLKLAGLKPRAAERTHRDPLVMMLV